MKFRHIFLSLILFLSLFPAYADDLEEDYMKHFAAVSAKADFLDLWPGFRFNAKPYIIGSQAKKDADRHLYAFNLNAKNSEWQLLPYNNNRPIYYLSHDVIGFRDYIENSSAPYLKVDEQDSIVQVIQFSDCRLPAFCDAVVVRGLIQHFEFYESPYAGDLMKRMLQIYYSPYYEYYKPESLALFFVENEILLQYIKNPNQEDLKDYVAVYAHRSKLMEDQAIRYEDNNLGARINYVTLKFLRTNSSDFLSHLGLGAVTTVKEVHHPSDLGDYMDDSFSTFIIPIIALALDDLRPGWQQAVESNQATPNQILNQHFHLSNEEINSRYLKATKTYGYGEKLGQIHEFEDAYLQNMKQEQENYKSIAGFEFEMPISQYTGKMSYQFQINNITRLFTRVSPMDANMDDANKTSIYIGFLPYLYLRATPEVDQGFFKLSRFAQLRVDGVEISVADLFKQTTPRPFHQLEIRDRMQPKLLVEIDTADQNNYVLEVYHEQLRVRSL